MKTTRRSGRAAQALVEFTLIAPVFFLVLLGILDFGRVGLYYVAVSDLARSGARQAAAYSDGLGFTDCQVVATVKTQADSATMANLSEPGGCASPTSPGNTTPPNPLTAAYQPPVGSTYIFIDRSTKGVAKVSIVYAFQPTTPMISALTGTIYVTATSQMDTEY